MEHIWSRRAVIEQFDIVRELLFLTLNEIESKEDLDKKSLEALSSMNSEALVSRIIPEALSMLSRLSSNEVYSKKEPEDVIEIERILEDALLSVFHKLSTRVKELRDQPPTIDQRLAVKSGAFLEMQKRSDREVDNRIASVGLAIIDTSRQMR